MHYEQHAWRAVNRSYAGCVRCRCVSHDGRQLCNNVVWQPRSAQVHWCTPLTWGPGGRLGAGGRSRGISSACKAGSCRGLSASTMLRAMPCPSCIKLFISWGQGAAAAAPGMLSFGGPLWLGSTSCETCSCSTTRAVPLPLLSTAKKGVAFASRSCVSGLGERVCSWRLCQSSAIHASEGAGFEVWCRGGHIYGGQLWGEA